jgi:hypothetical protein
MIKSTILFLFIGIAFLNFAQNKLPTIKLDTSLVSDDFGPFGNAFDDKRMVFFGENHTYIHSNQLLKLKAILHLHKKGFRYVAIELGAGIAFLSNEYIRTGDEEVLDLLNEGFDDDEKNKMYYLLLALRKFNKEKPLKDQIKIIGVDYTRYPVYSLKAMQKIIEMKQCQNEMDTFYEDISTVGTIDLGARGIGFANLREPSSENFDIRFGFKSYQNRLFELSIRNIVEDFNKDTVKYKAALGEYYKSFKHITDQLGATAKWYKGEGVNIQMHIERERNMVNNIKNVLAEDSLAKITGQFGRCHIRTEEYDDDCYSFNLNSMVERLEKDSILKNKILTVPIFYTQTDNIAVSNKNNNTKLHDLISRNNIYLYNTESGLLSINGLNSDSKIVVINTHWAFSSMSDILEKTEGQKSNEPSKRKMFGNDIINFQVHYVQYTNNINQDLGIDLLPFHNLFYGVRYESITEEGRQNSFSFNTIAPINKETDSVSYRYTNWFLRSAVGYNYVYRKHFDLFANYHFTFGMAKVREDRGYESSEYTYDFKKRVSKYRNPYFNIGADIGARLKFGPVGIFVLGGYHFDVTNPKWRLNSVIPLSKGLRFSSWYTSAGVSILF